MDTLAIFQYTVEPKRIFWGQFYTKKYVVCYNSYQCKFTTKTKESARKFYEKLIKNLKGSEGFRISNTTTVSRSKFDSNMLSIEECIEFKTDPNTIHLDLVYQLKHICKDVVKFFKVTQDKIKLGLMLSHKYNTDVLVYNVPEHTAPFPVDRPRFDLMIAYKRKRIIPTFTFDKGKVKFEDVIHQPMVNVIYDKIKDDINMYRYVMNLPEGGK